jgi:outer membrane lipoprotein SlyB
LRRHALPFFLFPGLLLPLALAGCSEGYSPNTYASNAAQQEAMVQRGVIIGVRQVLISASGAIGAAAGGAAGGVVGAQVPGSPVASAFGAIGGALVGGIGGTAAERAVADAKGWEYIVQETGDKLVSITQTSKTALPIGQHVLVIADTQQARIVPDYTEQTAAPAAATAQKPAPQGAKQAAPQVVKTAAPPSGAAAAAVHANPLPPAAGATVPAGNPPTVPPAGVAATPSAPVSTSNEAAPPQASGDQGAAAGMPAAAPTATSVQVAPGISIPIPPISSFAAAKP